MIIGHGLIVKVDLAALLSRFFLVHGNGCGLAFFFANPVLLVGTGGSLRLGVEEDRQADAAESGNADVSLAKPNVRFGAGSNNAEGQNPQEPI